MTDSLLFFAVSEGDVDRVACLIEEAHAQVNARNAVGDTPLHFAAQNGNVEMVSLLLKYDADVNAVEDQRCGGSTPLHLAVRQGHAPVVEQLVGVGRADVTLRDTQGFTPLHIAARFGRAEIVRYLLDRGSDPSCVDQNGKTAYYWAREHGHRGVMALLPPAQYDWFEQCRKMDAELKMPSYLVVVKDAEETDPKAKKGAKGGAKGAKGKGKAGAKKKKK